MRKAKNVMVWGLILGFTRLKGCRGGFKEGVTPYHKAEIESF